MAFFTGRWKKMTPTSDERREVADPPTRADLVQVARCRDCKRFSLDNSDHDYRSGWWCHRWNTDMVKPDGFCAWGERREDGDGAD